MRRTAVISCLSIVLLFGSLECNVNKTVLYILQLGPSTDNMACKGMQLAHEVAKNSSSFKSFFEKYEIRTTCKETFGNSGIAIHFAFIYLNNATTRPLVILGPHTLKEATAVLEVVDFFGKLMITFVEAISMREKDNPAEFTFQPTAFSFNPPKIKIMETFHWKRAAVVYDFMKNEGFYVQVVEDLAETATLANAAYNLTFEPINSKEFKNLAKGGIFEAVKKSLENLKNSDYKIFFGEFDKYGASLVFCQLYKMEMYGHQFVWILNPDAGTVEDWVKVSNIERGKGILPEEQICNRTQYQRAVNRAFLLKAPMIRDNVNFTSSSNLTVSKAFNILELSDPSEIKKRKLATTSFDTMWGTMLAIKEASEANNGSYQLVHNSNEINLARGVTKVLVGNLGNLSFEGLTGPVSFTDDKDKRIKGIIIVLMQYQDEGRKLVDVGEFRTNESGQLDLIFYEAKEKLWEGGRPPTDKSERVIQPTDTPRALFIISSTVASFGILLGIIFLVFNCYYREYKFIRLSAPMFNDIIVVGCIMCLSTVYLFGFRKLTGPETTMPRICKARAWLLSIGFSFAFGAMFIKTWRIYKICTNKRLKVRLGPLSDWWMLGMVGGIVMIDVSLLVAWEVTDPLQYKGEIINQEKDPNDPYKWILTKLHTCTAKNEEMWLALIYVYKGILLLYGLFLAYETRNVVYAHLNDSRVIGICVYNVVVLSTIGAFLALILNNKQYVELYSSLSVCISFPATATISLIFIPKLIHRLKASSLDGESVGEATMNHTFSRPSIDITSTFQGKEMGRERFVDAPSGNTLGVYQNGGFRDSLSSIPPPKPEKSTEQPVQAKPLED